MALLGADRGAEVLLWDRDGAAAERVAGEITAGGGRATASTVDVTDPAAVGALAAAAGPVDVLINNAGVVTGRRLLDATEEQIRRTFEVNTLALYWSTRAVLPGMLERDRGTIVTIASAAGLVGVAKQTDYSASKWAAIGFTESLRAELRADRSRVSTLVVAPYYINTGMFNGVTTARPVLLPILQERDVSRRILDAIESGRQQLIMPWLARVLPAARILPVAAFDAIVDSFGINRTMDTFTGRSPARP
jgi:all-trans-retinol dehydrogenase (NAD+)